MAELERLEVDVVNAVRAPVHAAFVRSVLRRAAVVPEVAARLPEGALSVAVRLTGDKELRRLNLTYAGNDSPTDVLSFAGEGGHLGDLAVAWPIVERQASQYGHPDGAELALLCVHGLLHLLGWDHASAGGRREMTRLTLVALRLSRITLAPGRL